MVNDYRRIVTIFVNEFLPSVHTRLINSSIQSLRVYISFSPKRKILLTGRILLWNTVIIVLSIHLSLHLRDHFFSDVCRCRSVV